MLGLTIRTTKTEGKSSLYTRVRIEGKSIWIDLRLLVDIQEWKKVSSSERKRTNYLDRLNYSKKLSEIEYGMKELRSHHSLTRDSLNTIIENVVLSEVREQLVKKEELKKKVEACSRQDVKTFVKKYVEDIVAGRVLNTKGKIYSKNSINSWKQFLNRFMECYRYKSFTWEEMDQSLMHSFINYLDKMGYMGETKNRHIGVFKTIISVAELQGLHNNGKVKKWLCAPTITDEDRKATIYLSKEELNALFALPLSGKYEKARDLFLIGCYTALRYSDFSKIEEFCIGRTEKGTQVIRISQKKVTKKVVIPILNEELIYLLKKYNGKVPVLSEQKLNTYIKEICMRLSETVPSFAKIVRTLLTKTERELEEKGKVVFERDNEGHVIKPRWMLAVSHSARRTAITNMYLSGKFSIAQMMSVSGHSTERSFRRYVKLSLDELADDVAESAVDGLF